LDDTQRAAWRAVQGGCYAIDLGEGMTANIQPKKKGGVA
jgi:hypothetical protein